MPVRISSARTTASLKRPSPPGSLVQESTHRSCTTAPSAICTSHTCCFDELRTRLRSQKQVLWLWLAIDPLSKILPGLHVGPRTQLSAHTVIHSLRHTLAPGCVPL